MRAVVVGAVLLAFALSAAPAFAGAGAWGNEKGIKHLHFEYAPIDVKPGQNSATTYRCRPARSRRSTATSCG